MLRITAQADSRTRVRLIVEGRLIGPWNPALEAAVSESRAAYEHMHLDLSGLQFADEQGLSLLRRFVSENVVLERVSPFIQELLTTRLE